MTSAKSKIRLAENPKVLLLQSLVDRRQSRVSPYPRRKNASVTVAWELRSGRPESVTFHPVLVLGWDRQCKLLSEAISYPDISGYPGCGMFARHIRRTIIIKVQLARNFLRGCCSWVAMLGTIRCRRLS